MNPGEYRPRNTRCKEQFVSLAQFFVNRATFPDTEGGHAFARQLVEDGLGHDLYDLVAYILHSAGVPLTAPIADDWVRVHSEGVVRVYANNDREVRRWANKVIERGITP